MVFSRFTVPASRIATSTEVAVRARVIDPGRNGRPQAVRRPSTGLEQAGAYPAGFWRGYHRVVARRAGKAMEVTRWAHNGTTWVSLHGVLTGWTVRAIIRVLRSEDRSAVVVVNAAGLSAVELSCLSDLRAVCAVVIDRGVSLELLKAPRELMEALATITDPRLHRGAPAHAAADEVCSPPPSELYL